MKSAHAGWRLIVCVAAVATMTAAHSGGPRQPEFQIERRAGRAVPVVSRFDAKQIELLEKLNRADAGHLDRLSELVIPEPWSLDERAYAQLPAWYAAAGVYPKLLVVHLPGQMFGAYESGRLERWGPVSTGGRASPTPPGWYSLNWRATFTVSTVDPDWEMKWYFNFQNNEGLAFHQYALPGRPASHGCIRLLERDAKWLFEWGEPWTLDRTGQIVLRPGTPVLVTGAYDFDSSPPWRSLPWLSARIELPPVLPPARK